MLDFNDFFYFVQVVDRGGFTAAGRTLRIPKSTLSHRMQQLEANLGVRLLNRTSRRFGMTDAGEEFYRHAVLMLREAELAETAIRHCLEDGNGEAGENFRFEGKAPPEVVDLLNRLWKATDELIVENWSKVERVAAAFLEHGELTQADTDAAIAE
jgi:hypothetical protein